MEPTVIKLYRIFTEFFTECPGGNGVPPGRLADGRGDGDVHGRGSDRGRVPRGAPSARVPPLQPRHPPRHQVGQHPPRPRRIRQTQYVSIF